MYFIQISTLIITFITSSSKFIKQSRVKWLKFFKYNSLLLCLIIYYVIWKKNLKFQFFTVTFLFVTLRVYNTLELSSVWSIELHFQSSGSELKLIKPYQQQIWEQSLHVTIGKKLIQYCKRKFLKVKIVTNQFSISVKKSEHWLFYNSWKLMSYNDLIILKANWKFDLH